MRILRNITFTVLAAAGGLFPVRPVSAGALDQLTSMAAGADSDVSPAPMGPVAVQTGQSVVGTYDKDQFLAFQGQVFKQGMGQGGRFGLDYTLSPAAGLTNDQIQSMALLGSQGDENTCARYALTALLQFAGGDARVEDLKMAAQAVMLSSGEFHVDADRVFDIYKTSLTNPAEARAQNAAYQNEIRRGANARGMNLDDPDVARATGYRVAEPEFSSQARQAFKDWFAANQGADRDRFLSASRNLRDWIGQQLNQGRPVAAGITIGDPTQPDGVGGAHAVVVVEKGLNGAGIMTVKFYNPWGEIDAIPWDAFYPFIAVLAEPGSTPPNSPNPSTSL